VDNWELVSRNKCDLYGKRATLRADYVSGFYVVCVTQPKPTLYRNNHRLVPPFPRSVQQRVHTRLVGILTSTCPRTLSS
jgi:hypothetical protein